MRRVVCAQVEFPTTRDLEESSEYKDLGAAVCLNSCNS